MTPQTPAQTTETLTQSTAGEPISMEELGLAARNHAMPLEALRYPLTPAGLHYLLIHLRFHPAVLHLGGMVGGVGRHHPGR